MELPFWRVSAFADNPFGGNPAGVCLCEEELPESLMQKIACENAMSETAFLTSQGEGAYTIRWFTPNKEIDLCGHATLASAHVIFSDFGGKELEFVSPRSGRLRISRIGQLVEMSFPTMEFNSAVSGPQWESAIGVDPAECMDGFFAIAVLDDQGQVAELSPDLDKVSELHEHGLIVTAAGENHDFVYRVFVPNYGIEEDPVTGSACCVLGPYWSERLKKDRLHGKQLSKRSGEVWIGLENDRVMIAGRCWTYCSGILTIDPQMQ